MYTHIYIIAASRDYYIYSCINIYMYIYIYIYIERIYLCIYFYFLSIILKMSEANEVFISSHIWVAKTTFKQL